MMDWMQFKPLAARHEHHSNDYELHIRPADPEDDVRTDAKAMGFIQP